MAYSLYFAAGLTGFFVLYALALRYRLKEVHVREPIFIQPRVPRFGHIIGLLQHGGAYYSKLSAQHPLPIYSMPLLRSKFYVINSLSLIAAASKISKKLSFIPFVKIAAERLSGIDPASLEKFDGNGSTPGIAQETISLVEVSLLGRDEATQLDSAVLGHIKEMLDDLPAKVNQPVKLLEWLQHVITQVSSRSVYGSLNPLQDPETEAHFWTFEHSLGLLLLNFAPDIFKKKAIDARERVVEKFKAYYEANGQEQGSALARARHSAPAKYGLTEEEIARLEVPFNFAVLNNTVAAAFWMLSHAFSQHQTLNEMRAELAKVVTTTKNPSGGKRFEINMAELKKNCPVLLAAFHEVLRVYSVRPNIRQVTEDTMLDDAFFLEKGSIVQMSTRGIHEDEKHWGADAKTLNLRRFLDRPNGGNLSKSSIAFGTFGVAPHICPGRHFAATEIMAITAQLVLRYNMVPRESSVWDIPKQNLKGFNGVTGPVGEMEVEFIKRDGWEGEWAYTLGEEGLKFALASG